MAPAHLDPWAKIWPGAEVCSGVGGVAGGENCSGLVQGEELTGTHHSRPPTPRTFEGAGIQPSPRTGSPHLEKTENPHRHPLSPPRKKHPRADGAKGQRTPTQHQG